MRLDTSMWERLCNGEIVEVVTARGLKLYFMCGKCHRIVRVNKPVLGPLHFC